MSKTRRRRNNAMPRAQTQIRERYTRQSNAPVTAVPGGTKNTNPPTVSDHALVRWLERVTGIDVRSQIESEMLAHGRGELIKRVGQGKIRILELDAQLVIRGGRVVTVEPADK